RAILPAFVLSCAVSVNAFAEQPAPSAPEPEPEPETFRNEAAPRIPPGSVAAPSFVERRWYGWQTALLDIESTGLAGGGIGGSNDGVFATGIGAYMIGAPIVHVAHKNALEAGISVALRGLGMTLLLRSLHGGLSTSEINAAQHDGKTGVVA